MHGLGQVSLEDYFRWTVSSENVFFFSLNITSKL